MLGDLEVGGSAILATWSRQRCLVLGLMGALMGSGCATSGPQGGGPGGEARDDRPTTGPARAPVEVPPATASRPAIVVELFSSEGCSSCPPADEVLAALAQQPLDGAVVVALEHHVDYWDDLGWKDPFSSAASTARQGRYAQVRGSRTVFTPEMVVDGAASVNGTDRGRVERAIERRTERAHLPVQVAVAGDGATAEVTIGGEPERPSALFVGVVETGLVTEVRAGENRGRTLAHGPVVRSLSEVGPARAGTSTVKLEVPLSAHRQVVAFVQVLPQREVLGAALSMPGR